MDGERAGLIGILGGAAAAAAAASTTAALLALVVREGLGGVNPARMIWEAGKEQHSELCVVWQDCYFFKLSIFIYIHLPQKEFDISVYIILESPVYSSSAIHRYSVNNALPQRKPARNCFEQPKSLLVFSLLPPFIFQKYKIKSKQNEHKPDVPGFVELGRRGTGGFGVAGPPSGPDEDTIGFFYTVTPFE